MRLVAGGSAWRAAGRRHSSLLTGHLTPNNSTQHLTAVPSGQHLSHARLQCVAHPLHTLPVAASTRLLWRGPARCLHTDEGMCDQVTTSTEHFFSSSLAREVVEHWTRTLDEEQVPEADLSAQHIVAHVLDVPRSELKSHLTLTTAATSLSTEQLDKVERLMTCRLARMPLQYILGDWDFHCITLKVVPPVFIPRPETEQLVELALGTLKELESPRVLEMCCGSGAISLALLHSLPQLECVAVDQSRHAVRLTEANAVQLGLRERLTVVMGKVTKDAMPSLPHSGYDLVVSNPPYVLRKDLMGLQPEIMMYEDLRALDGGKDGLDVIKAVVLHSHHLLRPGGKLMLEVDSCHPYLLPAWLEKQNLDLELMQVHQDFNKKDRFIEFIKNR